MAGKKANRGLWRMENVLEDDKRIIVLFYC